MYRAGYKTNKYYTKHMQIISRSITLLVALCLTGQNLLWATQMPAPTSLKKLQQQALQDAEFLSTKGIVLTALSIPVVYGISRLVYQQVQEKKALKKEVARLRRANRTLSNWMLMTEKAHHSLEARIHLSHQVPVDINKDVAKYVDIANTHLTKEAREDLFQQMLHEPWFEAFSKSDKKLFTTVTDYILREANYTRLPADKAIDLFNTWTPIFTENDLTLASKYLRSLCSQISAKKNILFMSLVLLGVFTTYNASAQVQSHQIAKRLNQNFQFFLQADDKTLTELEQDPVTYEVCVKNAAMLHSLRESEPEVLDELRPLVSISVPKLHTVTAR